MNGKEEEKSKRERWNRGRRETEGMERCREGRVEEKEKEWQGGMGDRGRGGREGNDREGVKENQGLRMQCQGDMSIR